MGIVPKGRKSIHTVPADAADWRAAQALDPHDAILDLAHRRGPSVDAAGEDNEADVASCVNDWHTEVWGAWATHLAESGNPTHKTECNDLSLEAIDRQRHSAFQDTTK